MNSSSWDESTSEECELLSSKVGDPVVPYQAPPQKEGVLGSKSYLEFTSKYRKVEMPKRERNLTELPVDRRRLLEIRAKHLGTEMPLVARPTLQGISLGRSGLVGESKFWKFYN